MSNAIEVERLTKVYEQGQRGQNRWWL